MTRRRPVRSGPGSLTELPEGPAHLRHRHWLDLGSDEVQVIKLHGDIHREDAPLHITEDETASLAPPASELLAEVFAQRGLIVVGYRAKDVGVRNCLQSVGETQGLLDWIDPDAGCLKDSDIRTLLRRHTRDAMALVATFDHVFEFLGRDVPDVRERMRFAADIDDAWASLERVRSFGAVRATELPELVRKLDLLGQATQLDEVHAILNFVLYERERSIAETYRLQHGVALLSSALRVYDRHLASDVWWGVELAFCRELLNLFFVGRSTEAGRDEYLNEAVKRRERLLASIGNADPELRLRVLITLGEARKERAMLADSVDAYVDAIADAEGALLEWRTVLETLAPPDRDVLLGRILRHLAVTYELEGDRAADGATRQSKYREWADLSEQAAALLAGAGEDATQAYALMNQASAYNRFAKAEATKFRALSLRR